MIRRRIGMLTSVVALAGAALLLSGCTGSSAPAASTPAPTTVHTPSPTSAPPAPTEAPAAASLPTDCTTVASPETWQETVGDMRLQSDGEGFERPAPQGATLALGCDWIVGEASAVLLLISTAPAANVTAAVAELPTEGYTCQVSDDFGAQFCVLPGAGPDDEETIVARDDVWIYLSTVGRNGRAFLSEIAQGIWG